MKFKEFYYSDFRPSYLEGVVRYPEQTDYIININCKPIANKELSEITLSDVNAIIKQTDEEYCKDRAKKVRSVLKRVMKYAFACRFTDRDLSLFEFRKVQSRSVKPVQMFTAEQAAFLTSGDSLKARLFRFECLTGLRREEVLALRWDNVDLQNKRVYICETIVVLNGNSKHVKDTKNHRFRFVELSPEAFELLATHPHNSDFVFYNPTTLGFLSPRQYHQWYNSLWFEKNHAYRALTGQSLPALTAHKLRHTFASLLVSGGADVKTVADLLGHTKLDTTNIYLHSYDEDRKEAVSLINLTTTAR